MLEGLHGKVHLLDVLVLHKDAQVHFAARHGGESVLAVGQISSHQGKQVARLLEWILPDSKMPALQSHTVQELKYLHNVETRFYCPQMFLSLDFHCRDDMFELK